MSGNVIQKRAKIGQLYNNWGSLFDIIEESI